MRTISQEYPEPISMNSKTICENNQLEQQPATPQSNLLSSDGVIKASTLNENEDSTYSQQLRETKVMIILSDCMQCYVRIPRCQIEELDNSCNTSTQVTLEQQIRERQEEEEKTSPPQQQPQAQISDEPLQENVEEYYYEGRLDFEGINMMETYTYIDLPWPESP